MSVIYPANLYLAEDVQHYVTLLMLSWSVEHSMKLSNNIDLKIGKNLG